MGCPIIMGRKTYESIGRLLPGRKNIIITRNSNYRLEGATIYTSVEHCLKDLKEDKVFIIGGAEIYQQTFSSLMRSIEQLFNINLRRTCSFLR